VAFCPEAMSLPARGMGRLKGVLCAFFWRDLAHATVNLNELAICFGKFPFPACQILIVW
jgi:hypothetical protein